MDNNLIKKKYLSIRSTVEVLFVVGFIIEFFFRQDIFPIEYRVYSLTPFVINLILMSFAVKYLYNLRGQEGHSKRVSNSLLKILINVVFIVTVIYTLN